MSTLDLRPVPASSLRELLSSSPRSLEHGTLHGRFTRSPVRPYGRYLDVNGTADGPTQGATRCGGLLPRWRSQRVYWPPGAFTRCSPSLDTAFLLLWVSPVLHALSNDRRRLRGRFVRPGAHSQRGAAAYRRLSRGVAKLAIERGLVDVTGGLAVCSGLLYACPRVFLYSLPCCWRRSGREATGVAIPDRALACLVRRTGSQAALASRLASGATHRAVVRDRRRLRGCSVVLADAVAYVAQPGRWHGGRNCPVCRGGRTRRAVGRSARDARRRASGPS